MKKSLVILISLGLIILLSVSFVSASWFGDFWKKITGRTTENNDTSNPDCANDCSSNGVKQCDGAGYKTCGNYDDDSCLEWSSATSCSSSETCVQGACVSNTYACTDSDGGKDYNVKGNVVASSPTSSTDVTDLCSDSTKVVEYFCTNLQQSGETYTCPNGCSNGACISSATTTTSGCSSDSNCAVPNPSWAGATFCDGTGLKLMQYKQHPTCSSGTCIYTTSELALKEDCGASGKVCEFTSSGGGVYACIAGTSPSPCSINSKITTRCTCGSGVYGGAYNTYSGYDSGYCCISNSNVAYQTSPGPCPTTTSSTNQTRNTTSSTTSPVSVSVTNPVISISPTTTASAGAGSAGRTTTKLEISEGVFEENTIEEKTEGEIKITTETKKVTDRLGNKVNVEVKTEIREDGTTLIEEEREFFTKSGILIKLKSIIENDGANIKIKREIEIGGEKIESGVEMIEKFEGEEVKLKAKLSNGNEQEIKIMPDRASEIALERLKTNKFEIELKEVGEGENLQAVYIAKVDENGKLLGLFKVKLKSEAQIDGETGEIISLKKSWWDFLAIKLNEPKIFAGNQTCTDDCSSNGATVCWGMGGYQTCGNYDADSCLELSSAVTSCPNTLGCINGSCVALNNQTGNLTNITLPAPINQTNITNITLPSSINWSINYSCTDSDSGKNYSIKGNVIAKSPTSDINVTDLCSSSNVLIEYFCTADKQQSGETYNCPNGCSNGACII